MGVLVAARILLTMLAALTPAVRVQALAIFVTQAVQHQQTRCLPLKVSLTQQRLGLFRPVLPDHEWRKRLR